MVRLRFIIRRNFSEELFDEGGGAKWHCYSSCIVFKNKLNLIFAPQIIFRSAATASMAYHYQCQKKYLALLYGCCKQYN